MVGVDLGTERLRQIPQARVSLCQGSRHPPPFLPTERPAAAMLLERVYSAAQALLDDRLASDQLAMGDFAQLTTVDADGIYTRYLKAWPLKV